MNISVNNKRWSKVQLNAGFSCLTPQTQGAFYYSRTNLGTDVSNLGKRLDVVSFSSPLGISLATPIEIWILSTEDNGLISYETEIVSGAKVIFVNTGGGGPGGTYTFNSPLTETGGNVNLAFDTNGLKLQNGRLTLDLTTDQNYVLIQNEIGNIKQNLNALEAKDTIFTNSIASINTKIGTATLQTTAKDLSGAVNELRNTITQSTINVSSPLVKTGNNISLSFENDLKLNTTGDKLTLNLLNNNDFKNVSSNAKEALKIADYTSVGRVKPLQNHFIINSSNGELSLDLNPTGVLSTTFASKTDIRDIEVKVDSNTQNITRIDTEIGLLKTDKADSSDLQILEGKVTNNTNTIQTINASLANKANANDVYTKTQANDTFAAKQSLELVSNKADANETSIQQINLTLQGKANTNDVYTKVDADGKFATKQEVTDLGNSVLKITGDQSANGVKTFLDGYKGVNKGTGEYVMADNVKQEQKTITFNFTQPNALGYVNHSTIEAKIKNGSSATAQRFFAVSVEADLNQTYMYVLNNKLKFKSPTLIQNVSNAVDATDAINKGQFDGAFNPLSAKVTTLEGEIDTLKAKGQFVSIATFTKAQAEANTFQKLNEFVQQNTNPSRPPQIGDEVVTSDNYRFIYAKGNNGDTWVMEASQMPEVATAQRLGIVKFGTLEGEVEDKGDGTMQVKGYSTLKTLVKSHTDEIQDIKNELGYKASLQSLQTLQTKVSQNEQSIQTINTTLQSKANANDVYTKAQADGKFATNTSLQSVSGKADANAQSITTIQQTLTSVSNKADANETNIATIQGQLANKADDNTVVKLNGNQTINGKKTFANSIGIGQYNISSESGQIRFYPNDNGKYVKWGDPTLNKYYAGVDFDNKVLITGVKDPTEDSHASNKRYVDTQLSPISTKVEQNKNDITQIKADIAQLPTSANVYTKNQADDKFATKDSLNTVQQTVTGHTTTIQQVQTALQGVSDKANSNETKIGEIQTKLNTQVVLTSGNQTIDGDKTFSNGLILGNFKVVPEANAMRIYKSSAGGWLYLGDGSTNYFDGIDLNNRVQLQGVKDPTDETHASNKRYVDTKHGSITTSLNAVSQKANANEASIQQINITLGQKANANSVYTKVDADGKFATKQELSTKANDNAVVKLSGTQTIDGKKTFGSAIGVATNYELQGEAGQLRIQPTVDGKYIKFGNPTTNKYFVAVDLDNKVGIVNLKNPTDDNDAANKIYVDTKHGSITTSLNDVTQKANQNEQDIQTINTTLGQKANTDDVYTKGQADGKFALISALTPVSNKADANAQAIQTINNTLNSKANSADVVKLNAGSTQTLQDALAIQKDGKAFSIIYSTATAQSYMVFSQGGTTENFKLGKTTTDVDDFYFTGSSVNSRWIFGQKAQYASSSIQINVDAQFIHKKYLNDNYYNKSTADGKYATQTAVNGCVKLNSSTAQTINSSINIANTLSIGAYKFSAETNAVRFSPNAADKWMYFGDPNTGSNGTYFAGLDFNEKVNVQGIKDPTQDTDATNKRYVDQKFASVSPGNITILDPNTVPSTSNIPANSFVLIARR